MNIVYMLTFKDRKEKGIVPYRYIGSKSNAIFENGAILDSRGNVYYGSSSYSNYYEIVEKSEVEAEIIRTFDEYKDALNFECILQKSLDVVADVTYFNLAIATVNNYSNPDYATYKHVVTGKTVRLERNHPMVLSEEYVGVSKGTKLTEEQKKKIGRSGKENSFYGKKHTKETKDKIVNSRRQTYQDDPERLKRVSKILSDTAKNTFSGISKTEEHKKKIGRKNLIMLKNRHTGDTIRIHREERKKYDSDIWLNPYVLSENKSTGSRWTTNGSKNIKIKKDEKVPEGFWYGRTLHKKDKT